MEQAIPFESISLPLSRHKPDKRERVERVQIEFPAAIPKIRLVQRKIASPDRWPRFSKITDERVTERAIENGAVVLEGSKAVALVKKDGYEDGTKHVLTFQVIAI